MKKLNFGIIGMGVGAYHGVHIMTNPQTELLAVCDIDEDKLDHPRHEGFEIPIKTTDYMELINNPEIDVIDVSSPDHFHREHVIAALEAGKHVFCEKPLALSLEDCKEIIKTEDKSSGKFFIGQVCRYAPGFVMAKKILEKREIGDLFFVESEYAHDYSKMKPESWRRDPKVMRSPFLGGACHAVDLMRWMAGDPVKVYALANQKCLPDWPKVMDATIAIYDFPDDVMGKVFCSVGCKRPYTMRTVIYGTKGTIVCDNMSSNIRIYASKWLPGQDNDIETGFTEVPVNVSSHNFASEIKDFIDKIGKNEDIELNAREGAKTVAVCIATDNAARTKTPQEVEYI